ncbi:kappa-type opioid receptor-like [Diadema antillarum]|uniref:kappa-type opioid receptor-like n=1 Tax=Diadema antillarum TaxID=105358 RepID=UPI003A885795
MDQVEVVTDVINDKVEVTANVTAGFLESPGDYILRASILCVFAIVGIVGNLLVFLAIALSRKLQTMTSLLIVNLSAGDIVICLVLPFQAAGLVSADGWPLPRATCKLIAALTLDAAVCSVITIMLIALSRCVLITKPRQTYRRIFSARNVGCMVVFSWLYPTITLVIPQLSGHGRLGYDKYSRHCVYDFAHPKGKLFAGLYAASAFIAFVITFVCYGLIFKHVKKSAIALGRSSGDSRQRNIELIITKNMLCVVCCYILCLSPAAVVYVAVGVLRGRDIQHSDVLLVSTYVAGMLVVFNSIINPMIYGWKHPHFRVVMGCMLRGRWREIPQPSRSLARFLAERDRDRQKSGTTETGQGTLDSAT